MKIVSKFRDFYDYADGYSAEPIYIRNPGTLGYPNKHKVTMYGNDTMWHFHSVIKIGDYVSFCFKSKEKYTFCRLAEDFVASVKSRPIDKVRLVDDIKSLNLKFANDKPIEIFIAANYNPYDSRVLDNKNSHRWPENYYGVIYGSDIAIADVYPTDIFPLSGREVCQELTRWLYNRQGQENSIPKIDDVTMAETKGFDKFSFRKDPAQSR